MKKKHPWEVYRKTTRVRNEIIRYKKTFIGDGTGRPDFKLDGQFVSEFFTKFNIQKKIEGHEQFVELVAQILGLTLFKEIQFFACDGRDGLVNYVYDSRKTSVMKQNFSKNKRAFPISKSNKWSFILIKKSYKKN